MIREKTGAGNFPNNKILRILEINFPEALSLVKSEFQEKGYAFINKRKLAKITGSPSRYRSFLHHLKKIYKVELTRRNIIVLPKGETYI